MPSINGNEPAAVQINRIRMSLSSPDEGFIATLILPADMRTSRIERLSYFVSADGSGSIGDVSVILVEIANLLNAPRGLTTPPVIRVQSSGRVTP